MRRHWVQNKGDCAVKHSTHGIALGCKNATFMFVIYVASRRVGAAEPLGFARTASPREGQPRVSNADTRGILNHQLR